MISTSQKEHLTYSLILQCAILAGVGILAWTYIIPWIKDINASEAAAQASIVNYNAVKKNGLTFDDLGKKLSDTKWKEELLKIIRAAPDDTRTVITKSIWSDADYIQWLNNSMLNSDEDKKKLTQAKQKINSILPTLSPISSSVNEEYITLKEYIRFIEGKFLATYDIKSNIVLGIQGINYPTEGKATSVGTFDLRLDFRATNKNIQNLITYVNNSGNPEILSFSWVLTDDKVPKILSNPLMTIEALSLENTLDTTRPDAINNGRVTVRFYVRGSSVEDILFLKGAISTRLNTLNTDIQKAIDECSKQSGLCSNNKKLDEIQEKYMEFVRSLNSSNWTTTDDISILGQTATSLQSLDNEFRSIIQ